MITEVPFLSLTLLNHWLCAHSHTSFTTLNYLDSHYLIGFFHPLYSRRGQSAIFPFSFANEAEAPARDSYTQNRTGRRPEDLLRASKGLQHRMYQDCSWHHSHLQVVSHERLTMTGVSNSFSPLATLALSYPSKGHMLRNKK